MAAENDNITVSVYFWLNKRIIGVYKILFYKSNDHKVFNMSLYSLSGIKCDNSAH